jgi:peptide deformylase
VTESGIVHLGAPVLRQRALAVELVDDEVRELVERMFRTMYAENGQGLAAPQVGVSRRIAVVDVPPRGTPTYVLINPRVTWASEEAARGVEGCLSIPDMWETVARPARVVVEALDAMGRAIRLEAEGDLARCLQHEIDHLEGTLYIDRLSPLIRRMLLDRYQKRLRAAKRRQSY